MIKYKIIQGYETQLFENDINEFIKDKEIISIQTQITPKCELGCNKYCYITYKEN